MPSSDPTITAAFSAAFERPLFPLPDPRTDELAAKDDPKSVAEYKAAMEPARKEARTELDAKAAYKQELGRNLLDDEAFSRAFKTARDTLRVSLKKPSVLRRRAPSFSSPADAGSSSSSAPTLLRQAFILAFCRDSTEKPVRKVYFNNILDLVKKLHPLSGRDGEMNWADVNTLRLHLGYLTGSATIGLSEDKKGDFHPIE